MDKRWDSCSLWLSAHVPKSWLTRSRSVKLDPWLSHPMYTPTHLRGGVRSLCPTAVTRRSVPATAKPRQNQCKALPNLLSLADIAPQVRSKPNLHCQLLATKRYKSYFTNSGIYFKTNAILVHDLYCAMAILKSNFWDCNAWHVRTFLLSTWWTCSVTGPPGISQ